MSETSVVNVNDPEPQTPVVPAPAPVTPEPLAAKPDEMTSKFAALAKKERMARMLHSQAKQKEAALLAREQAIAEREKLWETEFKSTPLKALKSRGLTYQDLTQAALNDDKFEPATEIKSVKEEIERFRQEAAEKEAKQAEAQKLAQEQVEAEAIERFKGNIVSHLDQNAEKYELTKFYDASDLVFQTVEEHYGRTNQEYMRQVREGISKPEKPKILSLDEACGLVEQYLESELDRTAKESKKFQSKYLQAKAADPKVDAPKSSTTLTNQMNNPVAAPSLLSPKNEEERMRRALAALG